MPGLPEVETVHRGLHALVKSYTISDARQLHPRALKPESIAPLEYFYESYKPSGALDDLNCAKDFGLKFEIRHDDQLTILGD